MPHRQVIVAQFGSVRRLKTLPADVALATRARHVMWLQPSVFSMAEPHRGQSLAPGPFLTLSRATGPPRSAVDAPAVLRGTVVLQSCCQIVTSYESLVLALRINRFWRLIS